MLTNNKSHKIDNAGHTRKFINNEDRKYKNIKLTLIRITIKHHV